MGFVGLGRFVGLKVPFPSLVVHAELDFHWPGTISTDFGHGVTSEEQEGKGIFEQRVVGIQNRTSSFSSPSPPSGTTWVILCFETPISHPISPCLRLSHLSPPHPSDTPPTLPFSLLLLLPPRPFSFFPLPIFFSP